MCGIAGIVDLQQKLNISVINKASCMMRHRGPDAEGLFCEDGVALLHRRLSIIDIATGSQPMFNEDKTLVIIFNGEIYNFISLRSQLIMLGHVFSTQSDTETILHAYEEWGTDCLNKLHGMFAFAIYNKLNKSLFLARDRCGEKPIYYYHNSGKFIFASEIKILLTILERTPSPDPKAIYSYLMLGYIPTPYSYFNEIKKLPPGSSLILQNDKIKLLPYYKKNHKNQATLDKIKSEDDLCDELDTLLSNSVKKMLISDVPLGAFLSGGVDSSLIVALMAKLGHRPSTFSISFNKGSYDESIFAKKVAQIIGTDHTEYKVKLGSLDELFYIIESFGEPFADSSSIPLYYLSKETKKQVTVALSGDGSDELFGGYRRYIAQYLKGYYLKLPNFIRKRLILGLLSTLPDKDVYYADSAIKAIRIFAERAESSEITSGLMINSIFPNDEISALFPDLPDGRELIDNIIKTDYSTNSVESLIDADFNLYLPDDILVKVDRMSMRNSLEVRAPFLDPAILEFANKIPVSMKIKGLTQKYILKKVALRYLPPEIVFRKKHGFMVPMTSWFKEMGKLNIKKSITPYANSKKVDELLNAHFDRKIDCSHKIFALMVLGRYLF
ncbi:MAG: asparagine synthase (glutamine-hydrolyzing) [Desulfamplus sp.]|nr:asparagine synthase (glutamine-hydrolyzing) [Desulfamplus sp.]